MDNPSRPDRGTRCYLNLLCNCFFVLSVWVLYTCSSVLLGSKPTAGATCMGLQHPAQTYFRKQRYALPDMMTVMMMMMVAPNAGDTASFRTDFRPPMLIPPDAPLSRLSSGSLAAWPENREGRSVSQHTITRGGYGSEGLSAGSNPSHPGDVAVSLGKTCCSW